MYVHGIHTCTHMHTYIQYQYIKIYMYLMCIHVDTLHKYIIACDPISECYFPLSIGGATLADRRINCHASL